jgi:hypothetical protein
LDLPDDNIRNTIVPACLISRLVAQSGAN